MDGARTFTLRSSGDGSRSTSKINVLPMSSWTRATSNISPAAPPKRCECWPTVTGSAAGARRALGLSQSPCRRPLAQEPAADGRSPARRRHINRPSNIGSSGVRNSANYLWEENRVLREQLGERRVRVNDDLSFPQIQIRLTGQELSLIVRLPFAPLISSTESG